MPTTTPPTTGRSIHRVLAPLLLSALPWLASTAQAEDAGPFPLPTAGCPMAHCDARMSDLVGTVSPAVAIEVRVDRSSAGATGGLGCVANGRLAACTGNADPALKSNLSVYDADGNLVWHDGGILGSTAWLSAAMISESDQVIAADQRWLLRADPVAGRILWQSQKPDLGTPISPVLVGTDKSMILLATKPSVGSENPELSVWDVATGALLWHQPITDPLTGTVYGTINTPAVNGNRAYVMATAVGDGNAGRLYAVDVCESADCGGRGRVNVVWHHPFDGPGSASPVLIGNRIFFDGLRGRSTGLFYAVDDLGSTPAQAWLRSYAGRFGASAAQDPRGGLWIYPWQSGKLLRLNERTGGTLQTVDVSTVLGLDPGYSPVTAVSTSASSTGAVVLSFGAQTPTNATGTGPHVAAVDVSTVLTGTLLWKYRVAGGSQRLAATGQYPSVTNATGARRVVFRGTTSSTFFIGEP